MNFPDINPTVLTVLGTGLVWLWRKARGEKVQSLSELLDEHITDEVQDALDDNVTLQCIEARLYNAAMRLGSGLGKKLPKAVVAQGVQWGVSEFRRLVKVRDTKLKNEKAARDLPAQIDELVENTANLEAAFTPGPGGTVPKLEIDVELIK